VTTAQFITNPTNIRYLTGFIGVDKRDAYLLKIEKLMYLFTHGLYMEQAKKFNPLEISRENPLGKSIERILKQEKITRLEFEETDLTVAEFHKLKKELHDVELIPTQLAIEKLRMIKRNDEIEYIKKSAQITDACFQYIQKQLFVGVRENDIAWKIQDFFRKKGAESAFPPIVAFGKHSSQPHYFPQGVPLQKQDIVLLDMGARVNGYCADMTRVVFFGKPKDEWVKAYITVLSAQQKAIDMLQSGIRNGKAIDAETRKIVTYPHGLGHAVGLDIHEEPRLNMHSDAILQPHMVITIEPGVYIEGKFGIRIEDTVLIRNDKIEILTHSPKEIIVL
jgi:Xaa-Pro aminopeptidase